MYVNVLLLAGNKKTNDEIEEMLETGFPGTFSFSVGDFLESTLLYSNGNLDYGRY